MFVPNIILSLYDYKTLGVDSIYCQVCYKHDYLMYKINMELIHLVFTIYNCIDNVYAPLSQKKERESPNIIISMVKSKDDFA